MHPHDQLASIYPGTATSPTLVFLSPSLPLASLHPLASTLLSSLSPTSITIISSYHFPSYITSTPSPSPPFLYLRSQATAALNNLSSAGILTPYSPPNLLHGLSPLLLTLSAISSIPSALVLLPTTAVPAPLNGPFPTSSTVTNTFYDAGGPTGLSDPGRMFKEVQGKLVQVAEGLGWSWWSAKGNQGKGFAWLEQSRAHKRTENAGSMYM